MQTERVTFLTTPARKANLASRAAAQGISIGEYVRRRVEDQDEEQLTPEQEAELGALIEQVNEAIPAMHRSFDHMIETLDATHKYIDSALREAGLRK